MGFVRWFVLLSITLASLSNYSAPGVSAAAANPIVHPQPLSNERMSVNTSVDIAPPPLMGGSKFGANVLALPNGNFVVTDPNWSSNRGAVYLYNGTTHDVISVLVGGNAGDNVSGYGVQVLASGDFLVFSPFWKNGSVAQAGAVTWCSQTSGCGGALVAISTSNSLVGSQPMDNVGGFFGAVLLKGGGYVVSSSLWNNGSIANAGAVTACPSTGCFGAVSISNSLLGSNQDDGVGSVKGVVALPNGGFVISSPSWNSNRGAVTYCPAAGCHAAVSSTNSLVGATAGDLVGSGSITILKNGGYVASTQAFSRPGAFSAGAVTPCETPGTGCTGPVSFSNSLVGSSPNDVIGSSGIVPLAGGDFLVLSSEWSNISANHAGAVTTCNSANAYCVSAAVSSGNSMTGTYANDMVGSGGVTFLAGGGIVVSSPEWNSQMGAVTVCTATGCTGINISLASSLTGSTPGDRIGSYILALPGGKFAVGSLSWDNHKGAVTVCPAAGCVNIQISSANSLVGTRPADNSFAGEMIGSGGISFLAGGQFVISSPQWSGAGPASMGAVTVCLPSNCTGTISAANSLVGSHAGDQVGTGFMGLSGGGFVISSPNWDLSPTIADVGAVTVCVAANCVGSVSAANSLVGSTAGDKVGTSVQTLPGGGYVVSSPNWDLGVYVVDAGAVTRCPESGCTGQVNYLNSMVGAKTSDHVSNSGVIVLPWGGFVVYSLNMDNGATGDAGAISLCNNQCIGGVLPAFSVIGKALNGGPNMNAIYDSVHNQLIVGRPADNLFTILNLPKDPSQTSITSNLTTATFAGQRYPVSVSVTSSGGTPTGTVSVSDGTSNCQIQLAGGTGSCNLTSLHPGSLTISAVYAGDATFAGSQTQVGHTVHYAIFLPLTQKR